MALVQAVISAEDRAHHQIPRYFRDRTNVFDHYSDEKLIHDFRFPKAEILKIVEVCGQLEPKQNKATDIPLHIQVLATLRFFARGVFQDDGKDIMGMSQQTFGRIIHKVTSTLCHHAHSNVCMPSTEAGLNKVKTGFFSMHGMPNVVGLVDGTHVFITSPSVDEPLYVCRKGGHSVTVQVVCDHNGAITNVVAKWPGSTHDAFIWANCGLREKFVKGELNGYLLGDSGYGIEPWLQTPYESTATPSHLKYNTAHKKTRALVERAIGLWKNCFRRFDKSGGAMQYKPDKVCRFIVASVVLHNMRRKLRLREDEDFLADELYELEPEDYTGKSANELLKAGNSVRNEIRERFFN